MRIRQVKPEFWKDEVVAGLSPTARLTYVGLWMLADDDGWFRLDAPAIALELYGWEPRARREKAVRAALLELYDADRILRFGCAHGRIPTLIEHQRFAGTTHRVYTIKKEHEKDCTQPPAPPREPPHIPDPVSGGTSRSGSFRQGQSNARKRDDESESEFRLRAGLPIFMGGDA